MISGRITPARIWVAPLTDASCPSNRFRRSNVRVAMAISPKPSVTITVIPFFSLPVIATPRSYPRNSFRSWSSIPPPMSAATPALRAASIASSVRRAPPMTTQPFMSVEMFGAVTVSSQFSTANLIGPHVSPPIPKMP